MAKALPVEVKGSGVRGASVEDVCSDPCRLRLLLLDPEWRPEAPWGVERYARLMAVRPVLGAAGGTPLVCPWGYTHCYKLESAGYMGFWGRGAETLASHLEMCSAGMVWTLEGPWLGALRVYAPRASVIVGGEPPPGAYCADPLHNPFFHEGGATLAYELYEQTRGELDAIVAPGYPALLESLRVGYERLEELGLVEEPPRVYAFDVGVGIPRWLSEPLELIETRVYPDEAEAAVEPLQAARLPAHRLAAYAEAARLKLLEAGELGRDERVAILIL